MKNIKKIIILIICQNFFVLWGCGSVDGPCSDYIILEIKSPDGVSIGSYTGEVFQNGKRVSLFYCENDQALSEFSYSERSYALSCRYHNNYITFAAGNYFIRWGTILSIDVVVYSFNKEMKSQTHFDLGFKYPQYPEREEGCETKTIEVILQ